MGNPVFVAIDLSDQNMMRDTFWSRAIIPGSGTTRIIFTDKMYTATNIRAEIVTITEAI
jgi:hypothetical protein